MFNPNTSPLAGMSREQLQTALKKAQGAYIDLTTGTRGVSFSYSQGDGTRSVTYQQSNLSELLALISQLQTELGMICRPRRAVRFRF